MQVKRVWSSYTVYCRFRSLSARSEIMPVYVGDDFPLRSSRRNQRTVSLIWTCSIRVGLILYEVFLVIPTVIAGLSKFFIRVYLGLGSARVYRFSLMYVRLLSIFCDVRPLDVSTSRQYIQPVLAVSTTRNVRKIVSVDELCLAPDPDKNPSKNLYFSRKIEEKRLSTRKTSYNISRTRILLPCYRYLTLFQCCISIVQR
jgi:hypothetical protein